MQSKVPLHPETKMNEDINKENKSAIPNNQHSYLDKNNRKLSEIFVQVINQQDKSKNIEGKS